MKKMFSGGLQPIRQLGISTVLIALLIWSCSDSKTALLDLPRFVSPAVAYQPRNFLPNGEHDGPSRSQIIEDLNLLRKSGFRSLVTYGSIGMMGFIPEIARKVGFDGTVIMGIWDIFSDEEWLNALSQAKFVDGYCLGNEGLGIRYSPDELALKMTELRRLTTHPVTTSESIENYFEGSYREWLLSNSDWLFPIAHPYWNGQLKPDQAVNWIAARHDYLIVTNTKRVIFKEAGFPTSASVGLSEETQLAFFQELESTGVSFFYFEAFDQPWKSNVSKLPAIEAHWGLFHNSGKPKKVIQGLVDRWSER